MEYVIFLGLVAVAVGVVVRDLLKTGSDGGALAERFRDEDAAGRE